MNFVWVCCFLGRNLSNFVSPLENSTTHITIMQGDRAGICVTQFDASLLERGLVSSPGLLPNAFAIIIDLKKIRFYKSDIVSGSKFHVSIGHATILSTITLFSEEKLKPDEKIDDPFSLDKEYAYLPTLSEGQLISKCPFCVFKSTKTSSNLYPGFLQEPLKRGTIKKIRALYTANWRILF